MQVKEPTREAKPATELAEEISLRDSREREGWHPEDLKMFRFLREVVNRIEIAYVATYPPQECGIATFTKDLVTAIAKYTPFSEPSVAAVSADVAIEQYPKTVKYHIAKLDRQSFLDAADKINDSSIDLVSVQHEYGIFGGDDGSHVRRPRGARRSVLSRAAHLLRRGLRREVPDRRGMQRPQQDGVDRQLRR